jgi:two-component system NtrC family sensor kinase
LKVVLPKRPSDAGPSDERGHPGRVLIIDDSPLITRALARELCFEHDVTALTSARFALEQIRRGARYDVIICDLVMADMDGRAFFDEVTRLSPRLADRIVFMTSYVASPSSWHRLGGVSNICLDKPIDSETLRALVRLRAFDPFAQAVRKPPSPKRHRKQRRHGAHTRSPSPSRQ